MLLLGLLLKMLIVDILAWGNLIAHIVLPLYQDTFDRARKCPM